MSAYYILRTGAGEQAAAKADIQPHSQKWVVDDGGKVKLTRRNSRTSVTTDFKLGEPVEETLLEGGATTKVGTNTKHNITCSNQR